MTITITWPLIGSILLALAMLWLAAAAFFMAAMSDPAGGGRAATFAVSGALVVGAGLLVCAGGGWL